MANNNWVLGGTSTDMGLAANWDAHHDPHQLPGLINRDLHLLSANRGLLRHWH